MENGGNITFKEMMEKIEEYHRALHQHPQNLKGFERLQHFRNNSLALIMEVAELTDSIPWKPWRPINYTETDIENAKREIIDIIFFLVALCENLKISANDLEQKFKEILINNYKRIKTGYSDTQGKV